MPFEVITCPLSACFLGMSSTQAEVARSLRFSDARDPSFDRDDAWAAYSVLAGPSQTGDGEPSFFDRMFRRVGRSPLSRVRAEATGTLFLAALRDAGVFEGEPPALTTARDEDFHGELAQGPIASLGLAAGAARRHANLALDGETVIYLPLALRRVVRGVPHDVGSTIGLMHELDAIVSGLGADACTKDALAPLFADVALLRTATQVAEAQGRVVVVTR